MKSIDQHADGRLLELTEHETTWLPAAALSEAQARRLEAVFGGGLAVSPPSYQTGGRWGVTPAGRVGLVSLGDGLLVQVRPKLPLANLFQLLTAAYGLTDLFRPGDLAGCRTTADFYELLAFTLIERVERRLGQGLYRAYMPREEVRPAIVGRLAVDKIARRPGLNGPLCRFELQAVDVDHNRILAWTLRGIALSSLVRPEMAARAGRLYRRLPVTPRPFAAADCDMFSYHRLNEDYRPLHALCRFFLEMNGPSHEAGPERMLPFLIDMEQLFEKFVAVWLADHLPAGYVLRAQDRIVLNEETGRAFVADLLVYDRQGRPVCVLDTKYKTPVSVAPQDIYQVTFYAHARACGEAVLVYPTRPARPLDGWNGGVHFRALAFDLEGDLAAAGASFLDRLQSVWTGYEPL